jgi:TPR repeat protein
MLGTMYANGEGVGQNYKEAVNWYGKAAKQGNAHAQLNLGGLYENGWGVARDYKEAVIWYRKASMQGGALAQRNLGLMYFNGQGVAKNYVTAYALFNTAAETDDGARNNRSVLIKMMTPAQIKAGQALTRRMQEIGIDKALK